MTNSIAATRKLENLHVGFWLLKDASWCQHWIWVGLFAAVPTLVLALKLVWDSRGDSEDLVHAIATVLCFLVWRGRTNSHYLESIPVTNIVHHWHWDKKQVWED